MGQPIIDLHLNFCGNGCVKIGGIQNERMRLQLKRENLGKHFLKKNEKKNR